MSGLDTCQTDPLAAWATGAKRRARLGTARSAGGLRFAFYARVSTTGYQDPTSSRRWQLDVATEMIAGKGRIVAEFIDVGYTRELSWADRPQAAAPDPLFMVARLAVAANAIDLAAGTPSAEDVVRSLRGVLELPVYANWPEFRAVLEDATSVLYLTDNAGEIVVDRLLIEQIGPARVTVAVRGASVLNDATVADAQESGLADMVGLADLVGNGSDAPATLLDDCDEAFRARFDAADMVIAKGQGNYESLIDATRPVFFLFKVKCAAVSATSGLPVGILALITQLVAAR